MTLQMPAPRLLPTTIVAMAALLVVKSAGLLGLAMPAHAETPSAQAPQMPPPTKSLGAMSQAMSPLPVAAEPLAAAPPVSASELALLQDLRRRRDQLEASAQAVAARESLVAAAEKRLAVRLDELDALQQRLQSLEAARQSRAEASWQGLVHVYETMKPKDAAVIFDDLDMPVLVQVMDRMQDRKAALVMAAMQPDRARQLTIELADLRSNANKLPDPPPATHVSLPAPTPGATTAQ